MFQVPKLPESNQEIVDLVQSEIDWATSTFSDSKVPLSSYDISMFKLLMMKMLDRQKEAEDS